jgi:hypothetical protein
MCSSRKVLDRESLGRQKKVVPVRATFESVDVRIHCARRKARRAAIAVAGDSAKHDARCQESGEDGLEFEALRCR